MVVCPVDKNGNTVAFTAGTNEIMLSFDAFKVPFFVGTAGATGNAYGLKEMLGYLWTDTAGGPVAY